MLNLVNRIEEHKAYQIAVSLFKKGVDPEIIKGSHPRKPS